MRVPTIPLTANLVVAPLLISDYLSLLRLMVFLMIMATLFYLTLKAWDGKN